MPQKQDNFREQAKMALIRRAMTVTQLANRIGKSRVATSIAINRGEYPETIHLIKTELNLR